MILRQSADTLQESWQSQRAQAEPRTSRHVYLRTTGDEIDLSLPPNTHLGMDRQVPALHTRPSTKRKFYVYDFVDDADGPCQFCRLLWSFGPITPAA